MQLARISGTLISGLCWHAKLMMQCCIMLKHTIAPTPSVSALWEQFWEQEIPVFKSCANCSVAVT